MSRVTCCVILASVCALCLTILQQKQFCHLQRLQEENAYLRQDIDDLAKLVMSISDDVKWIKAE